jgi:cytochrome oxidase Cu insertion factor (SCO1/SenC/PrrC family)
MAVSSLGRPAPHRGRSIFGEYAPLPKFGEITAHRTVTLSRRSLVGTLLVTVLATWCLIGGVSGAVAAGPPSPSIGNVMNKPVPTAIVSLPLQNQNGQPVTLNQLKGRVVLLAPFLTSCQEECPIATAALLSVQRAVRSDGLSKKVAIVEVTVDPLRDTPQRMTAYASLTGSNWPLLTAAPATLAALWRYFGIYYEKVPEGSPPGIDWETNLPYTYDIDHSDGFVLLDSRLHERFIAGGMTRIATVPASLKKLLDSEGRANLRNPGGGTWTVNDAVTAIRWALGR